MCRSADHVILGNTVDSGGPRRPWRTGLVIGASTGVHQFCRIGRHAFIGGYSVIKQDVLPFSLTSHKPEVGGLRRQRSGLDGAAFDAGRHRIAADGLPPADARASSTPRRPSSGIRAEVPPCAEGWTSCIDVHPRLRARRT